MKNDSILLFYSLSVLSSPAYTMCFYVFARVLYSAKCVCMLVNLKVSEISLHNDENSADLAKRVKRAKKENNSKNMFIKWMRQQNNKEPIEFRISLWTHGICLPCSPHHRFFVSIKKTSWFSYTCTKKRYFYVSYTKLARCLCWKKLCVYFVTHFLCFPLLSWFSNIYSLLFCYDSISIQNRIETYCWKKGEENENSTIFEFEHVNSTKELQKNNQMNTNPIFSHDDAFSFCYSIFQIKISLNKLWIDVHNVRICVLMCTMLDCTAYSCSFISALSIALSLLIHNLSLRFDHLFHLIYSACMRVSGFGVYCVHVWCTI